MATIIIADTTKNPQNQVYKRSQFAFFSPSPLHTQIVRQLKSYKGGHHGFALCLHVYTKTMTPD
jgi:hypothetical protein